MAASVIEEWSIENYRRICLPVVTATPGAFCKEKRIVIILCPLYFLTIMYPWSYGFFFFPRNQVSSFCIKTGSSMFWKRWSHMITEIFISPIYLEICTVMWQKTLFFAASGKETFQKHVLPYICDDSYCRIIWLHLICKRGTSLFCMRNAAHIFHKNGVIWSWKFLWAFLFSWTQKRYNSLSVKSSILCFSCAGYMTTIRLMCFEKGDIVILFYCRFLLVF